MTFPFTVNPADSLWERLSAETRPIVLYGTGNGADKIINQLATVGRTPNGVFASDGFVRMRTFRGMPVESYADILRRFGEDIVILVSFGSTLPSVIEPMKALATHHTVYVPEVPLFGGDVFTFEYFERHKAELAEVYTLWEDDASRALFSDMIAYRLTGRMEYLARTEAVEASLSSLIKTDEIRTVLDGGAFKGDTAELFCRIFPHIETVFAVEADARTFQKLSAYADTTHGTVRPVEAALWHQADTLPYTSSASRGAGTSGQNRRGRTIPVAADTVDSIVQKRPLDLLKLDVEGAEAAALLGAEATLRRDRPALLVSLYHRTEDLFALPLGIARLYSGYRFYLRRPPCIPAWDLMLYAIPPRLCANEQNL